jgi:hypothetical protein
MLELLQEQTHLDIFSTASFSITTDDLVVEKNSVIESTSETRDTGMQNISCMAPSVTGARRLILNKLVTHTKLLSQYFKFIYKKL